VWNVHESDLTLSFALPAQAELVRSISGSIVIGRQGRSVNRGEPIETLPLPNARRDLAFDKALRESDVYVARCGPVGALTGARQDFPLALNKIY
jgi:hypothetical protein